MDRMAKAREVRSAMAAANPKRAVTFWLSKELDAKVRQAATAECRNYSQQLNHIIGEYLKGQQ